MYVHNLAVTLKQRKYILPKLIRQKYKYVDFLLEQNVY